MALKTGIGVAALSAMALGVGGIVLDGVYIVDEGNAAVVTHWGKAVGQEGPQGFQFKTPIKTGIQEFDVRERRDVMENLSAATANQLPITATISYNWRMDPAAVMEVYVNYGDRDRFAANILAPRVKQAAKAGLPRFQASDLIRDRAAAAEEIRARLASALEAYPVTLTSLQIEDVVLPPRYLEAVMKKEEAREADAQQSYILAQQEKKAQETVQTANANRDARKAEADGRAYQIKTEAEAEADAIKLKGEAEAEAIRAVEEALAENPLLVEYERVKRWSGQVPQTMLAEGAGVLLGMR